MSDKLGPIIPGTLQNAVLPEPEPDKGLAARTTKWAELLFVNAALERVLLHALAEQLKRSEYKKLPLPCVWWQPDGQDWWLSTESGSRAIGTFEEAVTALAELTCNPVCINP